MTGYVYDNLSHQAIYIIFTIAIIITIIGFIGMNDVQQIKSEKKEESFTVLEMLKALFTNKAFVIFMIIYILFQGPASANGVYMPLLIKELGGSTTLVGTTLLFSTLSEIPAVLFSDQLIKKIPYEISHALCLYFNNYKICMVFYIPNPYNDYDDVLLSRFNDNNLYSSCC